MDIPEAKFDSTSHLSQLMWAEGLLNNADYQSLVALWKVKAVKMEKHLKSIAISAEDRHETAHKLAGFELAMNTLQEHFDSSLKLHKEETAKDEPDAAHKKPVL